MKRKPSQEEQTRQSIKYLWMIALLFLAYFIAGAIWSPLKHGGELYLPGILSRFISGPISALAFLAIYFQSKHIKPK